MNIQKENPQKCFRVYEKLHTIQDVCEKLNYRCKQQFCSPVDGYFRNSVNNVNKITSLAEIIEKVTSDYHSEQGMNTYKTYYPCYKNVNDKSTLCFVLAVQNDSDIKKLEHELDSIYEPIQ